MENQVTEFVHLELKFLNIIREVKVYMGMDQDFYKLCRDFEDVTKTIEILENTKEKKMAGIQYQIAQYSLLKAELEKDIDSFIKEEQKIR